MCVPTMILDFAVSVCWATDCSSLACDIEETVCCVIEVVLVEKIERLCA